MMKRTNQVKKTVLSKIFVKNATRMCSCIFDFPYKHPTNVIKDNEPSKPTVPFVFRITNLVKK